MSACTTNMPNIEKWVIFRTLEPDFISNIKIACVFGSSGKEALFVSKDDDVYALGSNSNGCLGLGVSHGSLKPKKVETLCKKGIKSFACGASPHVLAITQEGELYSWGANSQGQLGNGGTNQGLSPGLISSSLMGRKVIEVACGGLHSVALTSDGEVYSWGYNYYGQVGNGTQVDQPTPCKVTAAIGSWKCIAVACGAHFSMAVLDNGEVYGWGYNGNGELGIGGKANQAIPSRVSNLQGIVIQKIVCGYAHTMALSDEGVLYAWGWNSHGQLGTRNRTDQVLPVRIAAEIGRVVEIAASHYSHISAALTETSKVYMWGNCKGQDVTTAAETSFHSLHDVFACFASPAVTWKPMDLDTIQYDTNSRPTTGSGPNKVGPVMVDVVLSNRVSLSDSVRLSFDKEETSDLKFNVDGKLIYVHKYILKIRCEHFKSMFQAHWDEDKKDTIDVTQFSYPVYRAFLKYLYTDEVDLPPEDAIELLDLANSYCEVQLKKDCECILKHGITIENAAMLYAAAMKYCAKELEDFSFGFALNHLTAVARTEAFKKLDEPTLRNFIDKAAWSGAFKY